MCLLGSCPSVWNVVVSLVVVSVVYIFDGSATSYPLWTIFALCGQDDLLFGVLLVSKLSSAGDAIVFFSTFTTFVSSFDPRLLDECAMSTAASNRLAVSGISSNTVVSLRSSAGNGFALGIMPLF